MCFLISTKKKRSSHQNTPSDDSPHVLHLLSNVSFFGICDLPVREEQQNVADDGQKRQLVQSDGDEEGTFSSTHVVTVKSRQLW